jgi:hypothetical protein
VDKALRLSTFAGLIVPFGVGHRTPSGVADPTPPVHRPGLLIALVTALATVVLLTAVMLVLPS